MAAKKRPLEEDSTTRHPKKSKKSDSTTTKTPHPAITLLNDEVDFPRGGGTTLTPAEVKAIRAEGIKEANEELFKTRHLQDENVQKKSKKRKRVSEAPKESTTAKKDNRIEHLNYKRLTVGMKILGQVVSIQPLALIVSLPNQLYGHIPITNISSQYTSMLERAEEASQNEKSDEGVDTEGESDTEEESPKDAQYPELSDMFRKGQYVRAAVTAIHAPGTTGFSGLAKSRDELVKFSKRVELALHPDKVNAGTLTAAIQSIEDHGYILDLGIPDISGFLSLKNADQGPFKHKLRSGWLLDVTVTKMSKNKRTCDVSVDSSVFASSHLSEVVHAESIVPGALVQCLITATSPEGLNFQVLGLFEGTADEFHVNASDLKEKYKAGKKVKARILYNYDSSPPKFSLALTNHILRLEPPMVKESPDVEPKEISEAYPIGTILEAVKVIKVEPDRGIIVDVVPNLQGFIHISHVSDDHVPSLDSRGPWKQGSLHRARVTGYFALDGLLQLSLKSSVLNQAFLQVGDVEVGQVIKGTIKKLTDSGLFVTVSGKIEGVVWPNHYADIALKHPAKRFKQGASIKSRVLVVDPDRNRIFLTAKKTLIESSLPVLSKLEDFKTGIITHAVVFKATASILVVEFYNKLKAIVPAKEMSESPIANPFEQFPLGKIVKVRIISVDMEQPRVVASIRQAAPGFAALTVDVSVITIGDNVRGEIIEIHKDNVLLKLQPTQVRALLSIKNLANCRSMPVAQLRVELKVGEELEDLIVVTKAPEKGFVIVANKPQAKSALPAKSSSLTVESIKLGQTVIGRVTQHTRYGTLVKINSRLGGLLHPTDASDDYSSGNSIPPIDSILKATVIDIYLDKKQLILSTRSSRMNPKGSSTVVDREINGLDDLQVGDAVRGFVKSVAEHGLFVTIARGVDARVQIKELFDGYVKEWKPQFQANQLVKGRILSVDSQNKKVEMTFRSDLARKPSNLNPSDLHPDQKVEGIIKKVESYGLFIQIDGSRLQGLCHKSEISDNPDADVATALQGFREGDHVKAIVLKVEQRRISLSIKPSLFTDSDKDDEEESGTEKQFGVVEDSEGTEELDDPSDEEEDPVNEDHSDRDDSEVEIEVGDAQRLVRPVKVPEQDERAIGSSVAPMKISGFDWFGGQADEENSAVSEPSTDESDSDGQPSKKKRKKRKEIEQDLTADARSKAPESSADFERLLLASPNSSYLWVQYMSFQLQLSEIDKAREIARRGIQTIGFREEQERLNVWIALLNLENVYGTDDILDKVFKEAARANDSKTVHLQLAVIFEESDKHEKAEEQYKKTTKKFGQSSKVWTLFGKFYLSRGNVEEARNLLPRSLQSLEKRKHLKTISRFAQLEYKYGDPERGRTIFEGIVDSHPKRWDLWSIYMDMETGQRNIQSLRNLFDRVLALKMTSHKAKSFFKKWLEIERKIGDEEGAADVKQKAIEWTQRANNS
ncbi:hypothetical protein JOM56_006414 [Amanita muscaria]